MSIFFREFYNSHTHIYHLSTGSPHLSTFKYWGSTGFHSRPVAFMFPTFRASCHSVLRVDEPNFPSPDSSLTSGTPAFFSKLHLVLCLQNIYIYSELYIYVYGKAPQVL